MCLYFDIIHYPHGGAVFDDPRGGGTHKVENDMNMLFSVLSLLGGLLCAASDILFVGMGLKKLKPDIFYDLPGIVLLSLGTGMFGFIGIVSLLGG